MPSRSSNQNRTTLLDILACPVCQAPFRLAENELECVQSQHRFPIIHGVPILLPDPEQHDIQHEGALTVRAGYDSWIHRNVLLSLTNSQVVLDIGAGNMTLDDPCIIRMDLTLTPHVDIVADAHALPFQDESLDYVISLAVLEHLRQPFRASGEMYRALKRGGYVYADTNFLFAYHGYPNHFFNSTIHGIEQVFSAFTKLRSGVPPYQMPSYAVENILSKYLEHFQPENAQQVEFVRAVHKVLSFPLRAYDPKFPQAIAHRFSAGVFYLGIKQVDPGDTVIPAPIMNVYLGDEGLQSRYPHPSDLTSWDNLMTWAKRDGQREHPEVAACLNSAITFNKYLEDRALQRPWIEGLLSAETPLMEPGLEAQEQPAPSPTPFWQLPGKALGVLARQGPGALTASVRAYLLWQALNVLASSERSSEAGNRG